MFGGHLRVPHVIPNLFVELCGSFGTKVVLRASADTGSGRKTDNQKSWYSSKHISIINIAAFLFFWQFSLFPITASAKDSCCTTRGAHKEKASCCSSGKGACCSASTKLATATPAMPPPSTDAATNLPAGEERALGEIELQHKGFKQFGEWDGTFYLARRLVNGYPITGTIGAPQKEFEAKWTDLLKRWFIPGSTVAIAKNGKIIYSRGFGYSDINTRTKMTPDTLMRIASISKAITAVAALKLCEEGKLSLDAKVIPLMKVKPFDDHPDALVNNITLRQLLQSTGGWDRSLSGDPMFAPLARDAASQCSPTLRPTRDSIIQYWIGKKLDSIPGTRFSYSNFGYSIIGKLIETVSGMKYEDYVRTVILKPMNLDGMRTGKTLELAAGETTYYPFAGQEENVSLFPNFRGKVPLPYGGDFALEAMAADTGWIASSQDLVRFVSAMAGDGISPPINQQSIVTMLQRPDVPEWKNKPTYFAMGWEAQPMSDNKVKFSRQGSLPGAIAWVCHTPDGYAYAFCCNSRPRQANDFQGQAESSLTQAVQRLFAQKETTSKN
jgi:CubicO group peptidase (beta-lactamase class C family)